MSVPLPTALILACSILLAPMINKPSKKKKKDLEIQKKSSTDPVAKKVKISVQHPNRNYQACVRSMKVQSIIRRKIKSNAELIQMLEFYQRN